MNCDYLDIDSVIFAAGFTNHGDRNDDERPNPNAELADPPSEPEAAAATEDVLDQSILRDDPVQHVEEEDDVLSGPLIMSPCVLI